ncbi:MAG: class I SAM-dependent methyltransferase [Candidatus Paceibacterota bacterium]|jgi:SAM-dependent methyltransferase
MENNSKINKDWWKDTFGQEYFDAWSTLYSDSRTKQEVDFVIDELQLKKDDKLLDIPCGQGRHSLEFARRGIQVTGVDYSPVLLKIANEQVKKEALSVHFKKLDARDFHLPDKFNAVVVLGNSFGYFDDGDNEKFIRNISNQMEKGSRLILDLANTVGMLKHGNTGQEIQIPNGKIVTREIDFDFLRLISSLEWKVTLNDKTRKMYGKLRFYTFPEIERMLSNNGINISKVFGSFDRMPYSIGSPRMIIVACK